MRYENKCDCGRMKVAGAIACSHCYSEARVRKSMSISDMRECPDCRGVCMCQPDKHDKIDAIKEYRAITGMGLKESKDAVERYWLNANKWTKQDLVRSLNNYNVASEEYNIVARFLEHLS